jgi:hypothetical protein
MSLIEAIDRPRPVRPFFVLDMHDSFAERKANEGRIHPIAVAPFGAISIELRSIERGGARASYRVPVRVRRTTPTAFVVFPQWHLPTPAAQPRPPRIQNSTATFGVISSHYQETEVSVTLGAGNPPVQRVDLIPGVRYPLSTSALPPGIRHATLVRGAVMIDDSSGFKTGLRGVTIVSAPQTEFDFATDHSGRWVLALADGLPGAAPLQVALTAAPSEPSALAISAGTSSSPWGTWQPNGDGTFSIVGVVARESTTTVPDLVLQRQ